MRFFGDFGYSIFQVFRKYIDDSHSYWVTNIRALVLKSLFGELKCEDVVCQSQQEEKVEDQYTDGRAKGPLLIGCLIWSVALEILPMTWAGCILDTIR